MVLTKEKTEEIVKKIEEAIKKKTGQMNFKCPVCTNNHFSLAGGFTNESLSDNVGNIVLGGSVLPSVPIVCTNCGNTFFLNAKVLGLKENSEEATNNGDKKDEKKEG